MYEDNTIYQLRSNQKNAVSISINNNFKSGVHFHATGTGKSWIALQLILEYNKRFPKNNILWLCEQKSILLQQFKKKILEEKGYYVIYKKFLIINYSKDKPNDWFKRINNATFWQKPILLVINRSFLVSKEKYKKIKMKIDLIIHDECHSITNSTTQNYYKYIINKNKNIKCLGFSATPNLEIYPYDNIISKYTIYNAFIDGIILAPKIKWIESSEILDDYDYLKICKKNFKELYYKKIIIWCGIISKCEELKNIWEKNLKNYKVYLDTSLNTNDEFEKYATDNSNSILFCACKHREGSDIKNLDCCIFLDKVKNRNAKTFIQCIGRVLRKDKDNKKQFGLILDLKAGSCLKICDRMNEYLNCTNNFPWNYNFNKIIINSKNILIHELILIKSSIQKKPFKQYSISDLQNYFIRSHPLNEEYKSRVNFELDLLEKKNLVNYLVRAIDILKLTNYIPHVTRGSCGSSLICYLLGISNVDPVKEKISFSRFLNKYRDNLPDIDFDFPHYLRDQVFLKLQLNWPNQVARISNHVYWHEKSALREAIRKLGYNKRILKNELQNFIKNLTKEEQQKIIKYKNKLENTFRHYSLHCGGIIFFEDGVPDNLKLNNKTISQIIYDKNDISKTENFKIDILSSRGISQLVHILGNNIDFTDCKYDKKTYDLLKCGNNIGITLAESPLMRKALLNVKPNSIRDLAICLAIIRPAAKDAKDQVNTINIKNKFIFDDDAITLLSKNLEIDEDLADKFRRNISKNKWKKKEKELYEKLIKKLSPVKREILENELSNLQSYSFCKSHAYSYAQLVYKLAYQKANNPKLFWEATLKNVSSSYKKWVHLYEAYRNGVDISKFYNKKDLSLYAEARHKNFDTLNIYQQIVKFGYWDMLKYKFYPNCYFYFKNEEYYFSGLIANLKILNYKYKIIICFICVAPGKYIEVIIKNNFIKKNAIGIKGRATLKNKLEECYIAKFYKFY